MGDEFSTRENQSLTTMHGMFKRFMKFTFGQLVEEQARQTITEPFKTCPLTKHYFTQILGVFFGIGIKCSIFVHVKDILGCIHNKPSNLEECIPVNNTSPVVTASGLFSYTSQTYKIRPTPPKNRRKNKNVGSYANVSRRACARMRARERKV